MRILIFLDGYLLDSLNVLLERIFLFYLLFPNEEKKDKNNLKINLPFFKFDLYGFNEFLQFTNYTAPGAKYGKHIDRATDFSIRKISMSIQLTDPSTYEGGELCLYDSNEGVEMDKAQGKLIIFPSYVLHEVKPVTKGERNSLVGWVTGSPFK